MKNKYNVFQIAKLARAHTHPFQLASQCVTTMELLKEKHPADTLFVYNFLASNALELFAKSFLALRWEKKDSCNLKEINKKLIELGHDLYCIYQQVGKEFLSAAGINDINVLAQKESNKTCNLYRFEFHMENNDTIWAYHIDSLRYGVFAKKSNDVLFIDNGELLNLCKAVRETVIEKGSKKFLK